MLPWPHDHVWASKWGSNRCLHVGSSLTVSLSNSFVVNVKNLLFHFHPHRQCWYCGDNFYKQVFQDCGRFDSWYIVWQYIQHERIRDTLFLCEEPLSKSCFLCSKSGSSKGSSPTSAFEVVADKHSSRSPFDWSPPIRNLQQSNVKIMLSRIKICKIDNL